MTQQTGIAGVSEHSIQNAILRAYGTDQRLRLWRMNTGKAQFGAAVVTFGVKGQADLSGILPGGRRLEIEVKAPGKYQTQDQKNYQTMIESFGGIYIVARSVADVARVLEPILNNPPDSPGVLARL